MDLYKPIFHFMPEKNWMNDPNGPIFYNGEYHLFYQYNPSGFHWDTMHWGHAVSSDLVHWKHMPTALYPSNELGELHCFSGCAVIDDQGFPVIFYTSIGGEGRDAKNGAEQWMALSLDGMKTFEKSKNNPIMRGEINGNYEVKDWRDPFVLKDNGRWYMVLGGEHDGKGCVMIYDSDDLLRWRLLNKMFEDSRYKYLECPNMLKFGDKYVLVYSPNAEVVYHVGTLNDRYEFISEYEGIVDNSGWEGFYAPNTLLHPSGRKIMWGWLTEIPRGEFKGADGWAGVQSIPRILTLDNNRLKMEPAPEINVLRFNEFNYTGRLRRGVKLNIPNGGRAFEMDLDATLDKDTALAVNLLQAPDETEKTVVVIDKEMMEIAIDRANSSLSPLTHKGKLTAALEAGGKEAINVRIFADHSVIEVYVNGYVCISSRVYPLQEKSSGVSLKIIKGDSLYINRLSSWEMKTIW